MLAEMWNKQLYVIETNNDLQSLTVSNKLDRYSFNLYKF